MNLVGVDVEELLVVGQAEDGVARVGDGGQGGGTGLRVDDVVVIAALVRI